jgi:hypothetical protein
LGFWANNCKGGSWGCHKLRMVRLGYIRIGQCFSTGVPQTPIRGSVEFEKNNSNTQIELIVQHLFEMFQ